jgi:DNA modification methylase
MSAVKVIHGDSREILRDLPAASLDACVCDPPYALVSITKRFGAEGSAPAQGGATGVYQRASAGFMGKSWDTGETAFDPAFWAEVLRVLKPGAHLVAFGGTRTYHRLASAIEDAGFEIRDMTAWLYGSGFPKSHDISKAIDKAAGAERAVIRERYTVKRIKPGATVVREGAYGKQDIPFTATDTAPATDAAAQWEGWGTALKPALEPIVLARKPISEKNIAANVLEHGTGAVNVDGCRVPGGEGGSRDGEVSAERRYADRGSTDFAPTSGPRGGDAKGRWPANVIHDGSEEVVEAFPAAPGQQRPVTGDERAHRTVNAYGVFNGARSGADPRGDVGSAARFFYSAKADAADRLGSKHPTVKPVDLMAYLCRLVTPPGGTVLDPFAGSGTTGMACLREGFSAVLIEREAEYIADIQRRLAHVAGEDTPLFADPDRDPGLFDGEEAA